MSVDPVMWQTIHAALLRTPLGDRNPIQHLNAQTDAVCAALTAAETIEAPQPPPDVEQVAGWLADRAHHNAFNDPNRVAQLLTSEAMVTFAHAQAVKDPGIEDRADVDAARDLLLHHIEVTS